MRLRAWTPLAMTVLLAACCGCAGAPAPLLDTGFEANPTAGGWTKIDPGRAEFAGAWTDAGSQEGAHGILVENGSWRSPSLPVTPLQYYKLRLRYRAPAARAMVGALFSDADGKPLASDDYTGVDPSSCWREAEFCFRARFDAARVSVEFRSDGNGTLQVGHVRVTPCSRAEAARWADSVYAAMPRVKCDPPADRFSLLPRTSQILRERGRLRVVLLGDSIVNDTANSAFDVLLERMCPGLRVETIASVRGATGCAYYAEEGRVKEFVLRYEPDLVLIGGISNQYDVEPVRSVVRQIRAGGNADVLVMTGAVANWDKMLRDRVYYERIPRAEALASMQAYGPALEEMARKEGAAFLDTWSIWSEYVRSNGLLEDWLRRDSTHANARGKQAVARMLLCRLRPER